LMPWAAVPPGAAAHERISPEVDDFTVRQVADVRSSLM
jgi:hypothetical protein